MKPLWKVINICAHTRTLSHTYMYMYMDVCVCVCALRFRYTWVFGGESQIEPSCGSAVYLRRAGVEQLYQAQRKFGGIGNVLLSTYSQTENGEDPLVSLVNLWVT